MSASEETLKSAPVVKPTAPILNRLLDSISSVRVGVVTLCLLVILAMAGMLIVQQDVEGAFDQYFVTRTPAERFIYGYLGLFDVYHSWYFNALLLFLSLNIILASIDHFPEAWSYLVKPKLTATRDWLLNRREHVETSIPAGEDAIERVKRAFASNGYKPRVTTYTAREYATDENGVRDFSRLIERTGTVVFGERGKINRLGAYVVHVALLTLFLGHFVALQTGFTADVRMIPGQTTDQIQLIRYNSEYQKERFNVQVPFTMECTDIQQRLIDTTGNIETTNTMDWRTEMKIDDPGYGTSLAEISLNRPVTYRGYRFFQAQTIPVGHARTIDLELTPQNGGGVVNVTIPRDGTKTLPDGTNVEFADFEPDFSFGPDGKPDTRSGDYNNPVAVLNVTPPGGDRTRVFAFAAKLPDNAPVAAPKLGYKWHLASFEKAPLAHILSIKYDPYSASFIAWYIGGFGLVGALAFVFFLSHKRVWALVEPREDGTATVVLAGEANRNQIGFGDKFKKLAADLGGDLPAKDSAEAD